MFVFLVQSGFTEAKHYICARVCLFYTDVKLPSRFKNVILMITAEVLF